jgi:hypothetical protein
MNDLNEFTREMEHKARIWREECKNPASAMKPADLRFLERQIAKLHKAKAAAEKAVVDAKAAVAARMAKW